MAETEAIHMRTALQRAVVHCSERCLYHSAKWAAELLDAIPEPSPDAAFDDSQLSDLDAHVPVVATQNPDPAEALLEAKEINKYLLAKSLFDCREFDRCAAVFLPDAALASVVSSSPDAGSTPKGKPGPKDKGKGKAKTKTTGPSPSARPPQAPTLPRISQRSLFLALYAKFLSGEKQKDEDSELVMGPQDLGTSVNRQLLAISRYLEAWFQERKTDDGQMAETDGWLEYLYGIVLSRQKNEEAAMRYLVRSTHLYPFNWGSWLEITNLISRFEDLSRTMLRLPEGLTKTLFFIHTSLDLYRHTVDLAESIHELMAFFPTSSFLLTCDALHHYHAKDFNAAEQAFSRLLSLHPHRLDSLDDYANILYVTNARPKLAFLAHLCSGVDRLRPESCIVVGNYYALLSLHEKAVQYFRRALTLDRTCLSAWTLMGHEYIELKNTHAAIESYRRAVDVNRRDYRAWYGLGQVYEMLEMHAYALWYYKKAAGLRPWDGKMWNAVGSCLERMGRNSDGIKAMKRALLADSFYETGHMFGDGGCAAGHLRETRMDPEMLFHIASMYDGLGEADDAKAYMELCVAQEEGPNNIGRLGESVQVPNDDASDDDGEGRAGAGAGEGTGVTTTTSKARIWLARYAMSHAEYATASRLATELCEDGVEVEEAKALIREVRSRSDAAGSAVPASDA